MHEVANKLIDYMNEEFEINIAQTLASASTFLVAVINSAAASLESNVEEKNYLVDSIVDLIKKQTIG